MQAQSVHQLHHVRPWTKRAREENGESNANYQNKNFHFFFLSFRTYFIQLVFVWFAFDVRTRSFTILYLFCFLLFLSLFTHFHGIADHAKRYIAFDRVIFSNKMRWRAYANREYVHTFYEFRKLTNFVLWYEEFRLDVGCFTYVWTLHTKFSLFSVFFSLVSLVSLCLFIVFFVHDLFS